MKYWAYVNNEILGPFEKEKLLELPAFAPSLLICPQTPVGEKTEDWKEASTYPEISAAIGSGTLQSAPAAAGNFGGPAIGAAQPSLSQTGQDFKSLHAASVDPVPPKESSLGGISLEVGHLERSGRIAPAQAAEPVHQSSSSFDPISLSSISRKADTLSGTELPPRGGAEAIAKEPQQSFSSHAPEPGNAAAAGASSQPAAAAGGAGGAGLEELTRKVEALALTMASRQDVAALADPLRMKLDQMGEVLSSMKNSQFQREIMDKLAYLENSVGEIRSGLKSGGGSPAHAAQPMVIERTSDTVFGAQSPASLEKSKPAPAASASGRSTVILDQGKKSSKIGGMLGSVVKKFFKLVMTIALLAAVALVSVIGLKTAGVFDATKFIPFPLPFLTKPAPAAEKPAEAAPEAPAQGQPAPEMKQEAPKEADISPEIVYFARNYTAAPGGARLEDKISEITAAAGGTYNPANWQTNKSGPDMYETAAVIPVKGGKITFTFIVDHAKRTLLPADPTGKAAFEALSKPGAAQGKKAGRQTKNRGQKKAEAAAADEPAAEPAAAPAKGKSKAAAPAAKGKGKAAAGKKAAAAKEEFEYVYEDEQ